MPALTSMAYPDANAVAIALLNPIATAVLAVPNDFTGPLIVVKRIGGQPDPNDVTDFPIILVSYYAADYPAVQALASAGQVKILSSPLTQVVLTDGSHVLIDSAGIYVGEQELPDVYPDERRINSTYQLGLRRQFFPPS